MEAMDLLRALKDHRALGILYNNIALEEARGQRWKDAIESFNQALTYHRMVGNEEGLAVTYSQMGQCFLDQGDLQNAERCLNNGSEHYIKLGAEAGEAAVLRLLAELYGRRGDLVSAIRCLERTVLIDTRYNLSESSRDAETLARFKRRRDEARPV
jgi:tetratricopeptide (TPR) repeat protein